MFHLDKEKGGLKDFAIAEHTKSLVHPLRYVFHRLSVRVGPVLNLVLYWNYCLKKAEIEFLNKLSIYPKDPHIL